MIWKNPLDRWQVVHFIRKWIWTTPKKQWPKSVEFLVLGVSGLGPFSMSPPPPPPPTKPPAASASASDDILERLSRASVEELVFSLFEPGTDARRPLAVMDGATSSARKKICKPRWLGKPRLVSVSGPPNKGLVHGNRHIDPYFQQ